MALKILFTLTSLKMSASKTKRNIEIKAKLCSQKDFDEKVKLAKSLTGLNKPEILNQHDVFFKVPQGRLKLRYEDDGAKLVQYSRDDVSGPKLSKFNILEVTNGKLLEQMLDESIGILGALDKTRYLFIHEGRTRIHLDIVKNKGTEFFGMEFEVTLKEEDNLSLGTEIAEKLMKSFKLSDDQLLQGSYFELLNPKSK